VRFFRIPAFTGIETHRDDADRGSLRVVEGCVPHGPGGLRSGPVWKKIGDVDLFSESDQNHMHASDDGKGNSIVYVSRTDEVHDIAVFSTEHTEIVSLGASYAVAAPTPYRAEDASITPIGNRLYAMGDGSAEAAYTGKGPPTAVASVFPDEELYDQEWSRFPSCKFYVQGPKKTIFASGNPNKPLTVYISEPAGLTNPYRDSPHSTELTNHNPGVLSTVDILSSNASKITALSTRGDQVVVHTDKGCHLLYSPKADQAETGYRVEQVPATNFSGAVNSQVVSGESGSQHFWMGHDGQIYKDEAASRGAEDFRGYADAAQANWKAKGQWEREHPVDLSDAFATYDPQSGMYWVYTRSDEYEQSQSNTTPDVPLNLQSSAIPDSPGVPQGLLSALTVPDAPSSPRNLTGVIFHDAPGAPNSLQSFVSLDQPGAPRNLSSVLIPDISAPGAPRNLSSAVIFAPGTPLDLNSSVIFAPGAPRNLNSSLIPSAPGAPRSLTSSVIPNAPGAPRSLTSSVIPNAPGAPRSLNSSVIPNAPGAPRSLDSEIAGLSINFTFPAEWADPIHDNRKSMYTRAAERIKRVVLNDIDIDVTITQMTLDGAGGTWASASPTLYVPNGMTAPDGNTYAKVTHGEIRVDSADASSLDQPALPNHNGVTGVSGHYALALHELCHILGVGGFWNLNVLNNIHGNRYDLVDCTTFQGDNFNNTSQYVGVHALDQYRVQAGTSGLGANDAAHWAIPVQQSSGTSSTASPFCHGSHLWYGGSATTSYRGVFYPGGAASQPMFRHELMTPFYTLGSPVYISKVSIGLLADLGYTVDYSESDTLPLNAWSAFSSEMSAPEVEQITKSFCTDCSCGSKLQSTTD